MNIIVLQHIKIEDPGYIKDLMLADGVKLTTIELDEGEKIPNNLNQFDGMFCMGGPMDTHMEKEYPWLIEEKKAIKEFVVNLKKPYLGFCLGCQLLGEVVGGKVVKSNPAEIGIMDINFSKEKDQDKLFSKFPEKIKSLQWHSYEVQGIENNKDITLLASSPITKYQIFKYQNHAYGIQFHIEIKDTTVNEWGCVPEYKKALEDQLGEGALEKFDNAAKNNMSDMNNYSKILYENFKKTIMDNKFFEWAGVITAILYSLFVALNIGIEFFGFCLLLISAILIGIWAYRGGHKGILLLQFFYATAGIIGMIRWF
jgi:GMP synthase-like glutamine amidotransferase